MKFLVAAQLPRRLVHLLTAANHDALHTLDLPRRNLTPDDELLEIWARANRILVSNADAFESCMFIELDRSGMSVHA